MKIMLIMSETDCHYERQKWDWAENRVVCRLYLASRFPPVRRAYCDLHVMSAAAVIVFFYGQAGFMLFT